MGLHPVPDITHYCFQALVNKVTYFPDLFWHLNVVHAVEEDNLQKKHPVKTFIDEICQSTASISSQNH
jgi:hypothetical protein